jgi:glutamate/tyrosine decarboxylase-like PLP-dependent enzyme
MFGTLDPIALAAELIALSVHTSVYTFETAPIFTMIEREVISTLCTLIFEKKDEYMEDEMDSIKPLLEDSDQRYDGLMLPGGSISNLTALHLARYMSTKKYPQHNPFNLLDASQEVDSDEKTDKVHHMDSRVSQSIQQTQEYPTNLVAFVSQEAHYSFGKAVSITGLGLSNLITVPTLPNGTMNVEALDESMWKVRQEGKIPFFVAVTAGSTVRGSFDDIEAILQTCRKHERLMQEDGIGPIKIWIHVDGAWGGAAIFSKRPEIHNLVRGVDQVDSFTFNPHKMLGASQQTTAFVTRHKV